MAKLVIELSPTDTGHVLADFTWDFCKKIADDSAVTTSGCALAEYGNGVYSLSNPNVTADTAFRLHLTANANSYASGIFSVSDDNHALANADFNASQKTSLNAATPASVQNIAAQTGDGYARIGAAGAGLTAIGDTRLANLDATVSSRLAPGGTLATVTDLTNAPTSGDLTATMKASVTTAVSAASVTLTAAYDAAKSAASQASVNAITAPSAATVAAAVWDAAMSAHLTAGTTGSALNAAGSAGDPWSTVLPGVYGAGTAGSIIGSRLDAAISSRNAVAPDNAGISSIISALNDGVHGLAALLTVINSRLAAVAYTAPDNADVAAIKADVESVAYGLAAIKASLGSITLDLSPVTNRLDSGTFGLAAIKGSITEITDPLATIVEGSDPPMTRGQAIDQLYIADYVGPIRTIPAAPSPEQQTLYGFAREFAANVWSEGDVATMTINPNQSDAAGTILKPWTATATVDANGMFAFTPDKGAQNVTVKLAPAGGGQSYYRKTIPEISADDEMNITSY